MWAFTYKSGNCSFKPDIFGNIWFEKKDLLVNLEKIKHVLFITSTIYYWENPEESTNKIF